MLPRSGDGVSALRCQIAAVVAPKGITKRWTKDKDDPRSLMPCNKGPIFVHFLSPGFHREAQQREPGVRLAIMVALAGASFPANPVGASLLAKESRCHGCSRASSLQPGGRTARCIFLPPLLCSMRRFIGVALRGGIQVHFLVMQCCDDCAGSASALLRRS